MRIRLVLGCLLGIALLLFAGFAGAQLKPGKSVETKAVKSRGGEDPNIKVTSDKVAINDPAKEVPAPPAKGGVKTRGPEDCWVKFDNWTGWWVDCYADGNWVGKVGPWGEGTANVYSGRTRLYASAPGTGLTWGPIVFACDPDGYFTWKIR
jgi:hypothetical protein